ncbi:MAG: hypothetical protein PUI24_04750 [Spirochaetales bacterium]|nr:hypothetical protein [Spirochaetales bacterium]
MKKWNLIFAVVFVLVSCTKSKSDFMEQEEIIQIKTDEKNHWWYYFCDNGIEEIDLPQNTPLVVEKPWTEAVRISSAATVPYKNRKNSKSEFEAYAVVNRKGLVAFTEENARLFKDDSLFLGNTADSLVFSDNVPVFYFYRSSYFFDESKVSNLEMEKAERPFLVEFDFASKNFYPLVSYKNLGLDKNSDIAGFFWNGKTWVCSSKTSVENGVEFKYFIWEPPVELTKLNPALGGENFYIKDSTEEIYRQLNMPKLFSQAPENLKSILGRIPEEISFYVSLRDESGTSPVSYSQQENDSVPLTAYASSESEKYLIVLFSDGTVYVKINSGKDKNVKAFRLPKLPPEFSYGEFAIAGESLYVAWEESSFYLTKRSGFIKVNLSQVLNQ